MRQFQEMNREELQAELEKLTQAYARLQARDLKLNMARGKPGTDQLELSQPILDVFNSKSECISEGGVDCRNYGELTGIPEARRLFADYMGIAPEETIVLGSSSLTFMYDCTARAMLLGVLGGDRPWCKYDSVKFLCPVPGYDRHFTICETLGIEMINIPLTEWGPDMDLVEKLVAEDETVKGIWCVPKYTNPLGGSYSDEAVRRLAALKPAAKDFRIMWDNAYCVHDLTDEPDELLNLYEECRKEGTEDQVLVFASTSKVTFPGAGVAAVAASQRNIADLKTRTTVQTIGSDKLNQLRHVLFLHDAEGVRSLMRGHRRILQPKFRIVLKTLEQELEGLAVARWSHPKGGYFVNLDVMNGCAKRVVQLCKEAGVVLTDAGATFPYGMDPNDSNIRIAPSFPPESELAEAMKVLCVSIKLAVSEKLLAERE